MKKMLAVLLVIAILCICGCGKNSNSGSNDSNQKKSADKIDGKAVEDFMKHYMSYVVDMDNNAKKSFYSTTYKRELSGSQEPEEPHPVGYVLGESSNEGGASTFSAKLINQVSSSPSFSIDTYEYELVKEDGTLKIDGVSKTDSMELMGKDDTVFIKKSQDEEKQQVVTLDDLPEYAVMQTSTSPEQKYSVPKDEFTSCGVSSDGKTIIITTTGQPSGCFIAKAELQEGQETLQQGGKEDQEQGGQGGGQQGGQDQQQESQQSQPKANVKPVDLIEGCRCYGINFSPDNSLMALGLYFDNGIKKFMVYDCDEGKLVKVNLPFMDGDILSATLPYFTSEKEIMFHVEASDAATEDEKRYEGKWSYSLETDMLKQLD